jgi:hypothetical protein
MPLRPLTALVAALALLAAAPAYAQEPPADASREVERIYEDYESDGVIDVCEHEQADLQEALDTVEPTFHTDFPDFREALDAGIQRHQNGRCGGDASPTATATATASPEATGTPESGDLPEDDSGAGGDTGAIPPEDGTLPPEEGAVTPAPTTAPPAATPAAPPAAAVTPTATPTPQVVSRSNTDGLLIPGILLAVALLGAAALAAFAIASRRSPRWNHVWREAAFRTRASWADFSDWLRFGR